MSPPTEPPGLRRSRQRIALAVSSLLLAAFAVWCALLWQRSAELRRDLEVQLGWVEDLRRLRAELDPLRAASGVWVPGDRIGEVERAVRALARRPAPAETTVAVRGLERAVERLRAAAAGDDALGDEVWEASTAALAALDALEGRIQSQVSTLHDRLGNHWLGLNLLIVASLALGAASLALLQLAHRRRRRLEAAHAEALRQASIDPLTGLWNRGTIHKLLLRELARAARLEAPLGVVLIDVDDFKEVNVLLGHDRGSYVLEQLARRLGSLVRPYDTLGRFDGDAFLAIVPLCDDVATGTVAERLHEAVSGREVEHGLGRIEVSISVVYATIENAAQTDADLLIHRLQETMEMLQDERRGGVVRLGERLSS